MTIDLGIQRNNTDSLIEFIYQAREHTFADHVMLQAKKCILDYLGVTLAGSKMMRTVGIRIIEHSRRNNGINSVIGFKETTDTITAIFLNGFLSHVMELDDGHRHGMLHLGSPIISALFSVVESEQITGEDFLKGVILGYEAAIRLACLVQPAHKKMGYHATGTCGTIGAAIGIASALRLTRSQMKAVLSAAATSAAGFLEIQEDGSDLKPFNAARAAVNGYIANLVSRGNLQGPDDIIGGKRGFLSIMSSQKTKTEICNSDLDRWGIEDVYFKPYASCRHSHPSIEAVILAIENNNVDINNIDAIDVYTYRDAVYGHDHKEIKGVGSAKMSIPFSVAVAAVTGRAGIDEFTLHRIMDDNVIAMMGKIYVHSDSELSSMAPQRRSAIVEVQTKDKKRYREQVAYPKGEPENPMSFHDIEDKFIALALYSGKTIDQSQHIINAVTNIEHGFDSLFEMLR